MKKKLIIATLVFTMIILLSGCSSKSKLIGTWGAVYQDSNGISHISENDTIKFEKNGVVYIGSSWLDYKVKDNRITMTSPNTGKTIVALFTIEKDNLTLNISGTRDEKYARIVEQKEPLIDFNKVWNTTKSWFLSASNTISEGAKWTFEHLNHAIFGTSYGLDIREGVLYGRGTCEDKRLVIPKTVTEISSSFRFDSFDSVYIPKTITNIESVGFICSNKIEVSKSNPVYDSRSNCNAIIETKTNTIIVSCPNTVIPKGTLHLGPWLFADRIDEYETEISIPEGVLTIGDGTFFNCEHTKRYILPDSITAIGVDAFADNMDLEEIVLPKSLKVIDDYAFAGCISMKKVEMSNNVAYIGEEAFYGCYLETIIFHGTMNQWNEIIKSYNWCACSYGDITVHCEDGDIIISYSLPKSYDTSYEKMNINKDNAIIDTEYKRLVVGSKSGTIPEEVKIIGCHSMRDNHDITSLTIPEGVVIICHNAFNGSSFKNVDIPNTVVLIGSQAFANCSNLETINYHGTCEEWLLIYKEPKVKWNHYMNSFVVCCSDGTIEY